MNGETEEYELALQAREGDPDALAELVERTRTRLFAVAYAELRHYDDAHDAVANALLQICRHVRELREPERARANGCRASLGFRDSGAHRLIRSRPDTRMLPVCLLCADPSEFTATAYFSAGVGRLVNKHNPDDLAKLAGPFERSGAGGWHLFTERARRIVSLAQDEARALGHHFVGTEHLLLGLVRVPESVGAQILGRLGISLETVRDEILQRVTRGQDSAGQEMLLTPRAKQAIDLAYAEARLLRNNYIGAEHLLVGLIHEGGGVAAEVLVMLGANLERARQEVWAMQAE